MKTLEQRRSDLSLITFNTYCAISASSLDMQLPDEMFGVFTILVMSG